MDAVLNGPQGYTLLAIVIALAAYLRSVSAAARDKIEAILAGKDELWLLGKDYTSERIRILNKTRRLIKGVTHAFFVLAWLLGIRLCTTIFVPGYSNLYLAFFDFIVLAFLTIAIFGMWIAHWTNRAADDANFCKMTVRRKLSAEAASSSETPIATDHRVDVSEANEDAIQAEKDPAKTDQKDRPPKTGAGAFSEGVTSVADALTALGKLLLVIAILGLLWVNRTSVEYYAVQWLDSASKLGFLGWSIERQASAEEAVDKIVKGRKDLTNAKFAEGAIERAARSAPAIVGSRILWVDDHPDNNKLESDVLKALGIEVFPVTSNDEALKFLPVVQPDIIISDVGRDKAGEARPLNKCPAHYFAIPQNTGDRTTTKGELATLNDDLMRGNTLAAGFSLPEMIAPVQPDYIKPESPRIIFYSSSAGGVSASQCARLVTNRPDRLLHNVISALEEIRWQKLKKPPPPERQPEKEKQADKEKAGKEKQTRK